LHLSRRVQSRIFLLFIVVALSACYDPVERSYENTVDREASAFEYRRPIREVWPELLALLDEHGFPLDAKEPVEGKTLLTARKPTYPGEYRIMVRINRVDAKRFRVSIHKQYIHLEDGGEHTSIEPTNSADHEAHDIEWQLVERAEPARFAEIQRRARDAAQPKRGCLQRLSS
jgi:hypothetical protein